MPAKALPDKPTSKQLALRLRTYLMGRRKHLTIPKELGEQIATFLEQNDSRISELLRANNAEVIRRREINAHRKVLMEFVQKARNQFRFYAQNHRAKADKLAELYPTYDSLTAPGALTGLDQQIEDTNHKAVVNDDLASQADQALTWECPPGAMGTP